MKQFFRKSKWFAVTAAAACGAVLGAPQLHAMTLVDLELSLLVDVSGSVTEAEYTLQRDGYAVGFRSPDVLDAIQAGDVGSIAVNMIQWSSPDQQTVVLDWTVVDDAASAEALAVSIESIARAGNGSTALDAALQFATPLFGHETGGVDNDIHSTRQVIDVSGDGTSPEAATRAARDATLAAGVDNVNGVVIGDVGIFKFYQHSLIGGAGSFALHSLTFDDFSDVVTGKLEKEIIGPTANPEPVTAVLGLMSLGAVGLSTRRRRAV